MAKPNWGRGIGMGLSSLGQSMMDRAMMEQRWRQAQELEDARTANDERLMRLRFGLEDDQRDAIDPVLYYANPVQGPTQAGMPQQGLPDMVGPQQMPTPQFDVRASMLPADLRGQMLRQMLGVPEQGKAPTPMRQLQLPGGAVIDVPADDYLLEAGRAANATGQVPSFTPDGAQWAQPQSNEDMLPLSLPGGGVRLVPSSKYRMEVSSVATQTGMTPVYGEGGLVASWKEGRPTPGGGGARTASPGTIKTWTDMNFGNPEVGRVGNVYDSGFESISPPLLGDLAAARDDSLAAGRGLDQNLARQVYGDVLRDREMTEADAVMSPQIYSDFQNQFLDRLDAEGWRAESKGKETQWKKDRWGPIKDKRVSDQEFRTSVARKYIIEEMSKTLKDDVPSVVAASLFKFANDNGITFNDLINELDGIHEDERRYLLKVAKMKKNDRDAVVGGGAGKDLADEVYEELTF